MKRITIAGLLAAAVALAPLSQQKAEAWGGGFGSGCGSFQLGLNLGVNWQYNLGSCGGGCAYDCAPCPAYGCGYGCGYGGYGYGGPAVEYGGYPTCAAPVMTPPAAAPTGVQNAAYYQGGYGYPAPSYWYGR